MIKSLITIPYELARLPLATLDRGLGRLPETSLPRTTLGRAIGSVDVLAGTVLRDDEIAGRGADRLERAGKLAESAPLKHEAEDRRRQAEKVAEAGRQEAEEKRQEAADQVAAGVSEAEQVEAEAKEQAAANAKKAASAKKKAADQKAANARETVEKRKERVAAASEEKKKAARRQAKSELDDARESKESAAEARKDAEVLSDLTEAKKERRQD